MVCSLTTARCASRFSNEFKPPCWRRLANTAIRVSFLLRTPSASWYATNFNDAAWSSGLGGFGTAGTPGAVVRTTWNTADIWLRRTFNPGALTAQQISNLVFRVHHDEDAEIYLNGVLAFSASGYT